MLLFQISVFFGLWLKMSLYFVELPVFFWRDILDSSCINRKPASGALLVFGIGTGEFLGLLSCLMMTLTLEFGMLQRCTALVLIQLVTNHSWPGLFTVIRLGSMLDSCFLTSSEKQSHCTFIVDRVCK